MLYSLSNRMAVRLANHGVINRESIDVYIYGLELVFSFVFSSVIILLTGLVLSRVLDTVIFLVIFVVLRSFTGGYHAKTFLRCSIVTSSLYLSVMGLSMIFNSIPLTIYGLVTAVGLVIIALIAPVENSNKPIPQNKKTRHKITSMSIYIFFSIIGLMFIFFDIALVSSVFFSLIADIILLFPKENTKGELEIG